MGTLMQARIGACALRYEDFDAHQYPRLAAQYQEIKQKRLQFHRNAGVSRLVDHS